MAFLKNSWTDLIKDNGRKVAQISQCDLPMPDLFVAVFDIFRRRDSVVGYEIDFFALLQNLESE